MVTLKDIAFRVNRSVTTVSRALSECSDVSPDTIRMVKEAAAQMGYVPNSLARRLQKRSTDTIGVVAPVSSKGYAESFFCELLAGVGEEASARGYDLLVAYATEATELSIYRKLITERRVDGFIISRTLRKDPRVDFLREANFPFAVFGRVDGPQDYPYVEEDGAYAMCRIADHLVARGHRRIACIAPPLSVMYAYQRFRGLSERLGELGFPLSDDMARLGGFDQQDGYVQAGILLDLPDPPTAIVGFNDIIAFGAINAVKEKGRKVGSDIAVTGFDDIPMASYFRPPLTTVRQPLHAIGKQVTQLLIDCIQQRCLGDGSGTATAESLESRQILLRPDLIIRESS